VDDFLGNKMMTTDDYLIVVRIVSVIALIFSTTVVVTILYFEDMKKKLFFQCILMISLADMGTSIISIWGFLESGPLCTVQGIGAVFFPVASWCWTTVLSYSIFSIIRWERVTINLKYCHLICWGLPACCAFLPLTTSRYGPANINLQWCIILAKPDSPVWAEQFWIFAAFFGWFAVFVVLMCGWALYIFYRLIWQQTVATRVVQRIYNKLWLYPVAMFICWAVNFVVIEFADSTNAQTTVISMIFGVSNGIWSTLIFFFKSTEARARWHDVIYPGKGTAYNSSGANTTGQQMQGGGGGGGGGAEAQSNYSEYTITDHSETGSQSISSTGNSSEAHSRTEGAGAGTTDPTVANTSINSNFSTRPNSNRITKHSKSQSRTSLRASNGAVGKTFSSSSFGLNPSNVRPSSGRRPRNSLKPYIVEDFDVDDDGDGTAMVFYDDFTNASDHWGSSMHSSMASRYTGQSNRSNGGSEMMPNNNSSIIENPIAEMYRNYAGGVELRSSNPEVGNNYHSSSERV
jgi:hypothetical protein